MAARTHGKSYTKLYDQWKGMRNRVRNFPGYKHLYVYEPWEDYKEFEKWANSNGYKSGLSLDRINNTKGYEPDNCRFILCKYQNRNRRSNRIIDAFGETKTLAEWIEDPRCVVIRQVVTSRIDSGWSAESALATPSDYRRKPKIEIDLTNI